MSGFYINLGMAVVAAFIIYAGHYSLTRRRLWKPGCLKRSDIILFPMLVFGLYLFIPFLYLEPYQGKVIDKETGRPIPGAVVLVVYTTVTRGIPMPPCGDGAGPFYTDVALREAKTDVNGEFHLRADWEMRKYRSGTPSGYLYVWKPGYNWAKKNWPNAYWPNADNYIRSDKHYRKGPPPYTVYELRPLRTVEERWTACFPFLEIIEEFPSENSEYYISLAKKEFDDLVLMEAPIPSARSGDTVFSKVALDNLVITSTVPDLEIAILQDVITGQKMLIHMYSEFSRDEAKVWEIRDDELIVRIKSESVVMRVQPNVE